jgi:hypothetical protein
VLESLKSGTEFTLMPELVPISKNPDPKYVLLESRVADLHSFHPDPDPAF